MEHLRDLGSLGAHEAPRGGLYLRLVIASPSIGGPGRVGHTLDWEEAVKQLKRKRAFFKQMAANSRVGAGIAAD